MSNIFCCEFVVLGTDSCKSYLTRHMYFCAVEPPKGIPSIGLYSKDSCFGRDLLGVLVSHINLGTRNPKP